MTLPHSVGAKLNAARRARARADKASRDAHDATVAAVLALREAGFSVREVGKMLDLSIGRVSQLEHGDPQAEARYKARRRT